jgi:glycyl-tRNA synthetase
MDLNHSVNSYILSLLLKSVHFLDPGKQLTQKTMQVNTSSSTPTAGSLPSTDAEDDLFSLQAKITTQASLVKQLKKDAAPASQIAAEVATLVSLRERLLELEKSVAARIPASEIFNRKAFDELILRKMYVVPSFEIHNGPAGLFDYGPPACALKANVLALWRSHFVAEEGMLEMECTNLTPSSVLETSGHVDRFTDFMARDARTGECFRADKLLEDAIDRLIAASPNMSASEEETHRLVQVCLIV